MNIVVTGSLGSISQPLAEALLQQGHAVTVVSREPAKRAAIEALGATAAIGSLEDGPFLAATFAGADAAYCMTPFDFKAADQGAYFRTITHNYVEAIRQAGVLRAVVLSGWTAGVLRPGSAEDAFRELVGVGITYLRPAYFYSNFYGLISLIKERGLIAANFGGDDPLVLVSPHDIAAAAAEELQTPLTGPKVRYVASDEMTCSAAARILGAAIGQPDLPWVTLTDQQMQQSLETAGFPPQLAHGMVEMQAAIHSGAVVENYHRHQPVLGQVKLTDFAPEFAAAYAAAG
ncbi:NAD-dependent dehydratase [Hymenobacter psoromatis]|nr:NAD-dependent dehydratase [Hymenobacter psoromatis]